MILSTEFVNNWPVPISILNYIGEQFRRGVFGLLGSAMFFMSWIYQAKLSKEKGKSVVDKWFWIMRMSGLGLITVHAIVIKDLVFIMMNSLGLCLAGYNFYLSIKVKQDDKMC
jgi:lipid-A-disaccharide synthase-like uncharacterized protein